MDDKHVGSTETQSQKKLEKFSKWDDVKVVIAIITITLIAVIVVIIKALLNLEEVSILESGLIMFLSNKESVNNSTFVPLKQQKMSKMKITGVGYIPCQGYVPCDTPDFDEGEENL